MSTQIDRLDLAIRAAAPGADLSKWLTAIDDAFAAGDLTTPRRVAGALGQFSVEAGPSFSEIEENLYYSHAERIVAVFPNEFPTVAVAQAYTCNPQALANRAYAIKEGNGDEASGDGYLFRGRGLIQVTGRREYASFGNTIGMSPEDAANYCATPEGAVASAIWYWNAYQLSPMADDWRLTAITRAVNGAAEEGLQARIAASNAALAALGGS